MTKNIGEGLTNFGQSLERMQKQHHDHELETIQLGHMSDEDKCKLLKYELYSSTRGRGNPEHLQQLRLTIELLSQQVEQERKHQYSLPRLLNELSTTVLSVGLLLVIGSFLMSPFCGSSKSRLCTDVKRVPQAIEQYIKEPSDKVLPPTENFR